MILLPNNPTIEDELNWIIHGYSLIMQNTRLKEGETEQTKNRLERRSNKIYATIANLRESITYKSEQQAQEIKDLKKQLDNTLQLVL